MEVRAEQPEIVEVVVAEATPVDELDAELEGGIRLANELVLVDAEQLVEEDDRRNRGLADADSADFFGLRSSVIRCVAATFFASAAAAIHPAVPPPTITMSRILLSISSRPLLRILTTAPRRTDRRSACSSHAPPRRPEPLLNLPD